MMVLLTTPAAVELSAWTSDVDCFQTISINVCRMGTISLAVMYSTPSSASAAENMTNLMIWAIVRIGPFHSGVGSFSENIYMGSRTAARRGFVVGFSIRMGCQDHFNGPISDSIIGVCRNVV